VKRRRATGKQLDDALREQPMSSSTAAGRQPGIKACEKQSTTDHKQANEWPAEEQGFDNWVRCVFASMHLQCTCAGASTAEQR
jgi:hypothetical protein